MTEQSVYVYIRSLRRKLEPIATRPRILLSRYGMGYQLAHSWQGTEGGDLSHAH